MSDFNREKTLENIIDTQNETIKSYHLIMVALEHEIEKLKARKDRPHGEWINNEHDIPVCSECGYFTPYDRAIYDYEYGNYCPNCGARMESK